MAPGKTPENYLSLPNQRQHQHGSPDNPGQGNPDQSFLMTDEEVESLNIKDLNRKLKEKGLSREQIDILKQRRRTLKNRKYATECRGKKDTEVQNLEGAKDNEMKTWNAFVDENKRLREDIDKMQKMYLRVVEFAKKNNIKLRERDVPISRKS